jgi:hypothetical protein
MENKDSGIVEDDDGWTWSDEHAPDHPLINTFIILDDYTSEKIIDYHYGPTFNKKEKYNYVNCMEDTHIIFIAREIKESNNILHIKASVGYYYDENYTVELIYDINENKIYVASYYRLLHAPEENILFKNTYEISHDKIWKYDNDKLIEINKNTYDLVINDDSIPYYRFPRSKDGVGIPRIIYNAFKIFNDESVPTELKPKIIIPANYCVYAANNN